MWIAIMCGIERSFLWKYRYGTLYVNMKQAARRSDASARAFSIKAFMIWYNICRVLEGLSNVIACLCS